MSLTNWTHQRIQRLFNRYTKRFWQGKLAGWTVDTSGDHPGAFGYCNPNTHRISVRLGTHETDREVKATLVHEMAHAATNGAHGRKWRNELERLTKAGAPTSPLDFLTPYSARPIVTSFIAAAHEGDVSWDEALAELGTSFDLCGPDGRPVSQRASHILRQCKKFFHMELRGRRRAVRRS